MIQPDTAQTGRDGSLGWTDMVMDTSGTFDYTFVVPDGKPSATREMTGRLRGAIEGDPHRLLGHSPNLSAVEYQREPWQLYCRITLTATEKRHAVAASFSFSVDRELIAMLRANDVLHISRTHCAGLGLSVLRGKELAAAAGAVTKVPLGPSVAVSHPWELVAQAEAIFRTRDPQYHMDCCPVEVRVGAVTHLLHTGRPTVDDYEILVRHGFVRGIPGTDECVSIERRNVCPSTAAHNSAQLMEEDEDATRFGEIGRARRV